MSAIEEFLKNNEAFAEGFDKGDLPLPPAKKVAVVACMDARLNPYPILALSIGDAHVIRNAGGVITDDEIRSLAISQHLHKRLPVYEPTSNCWDSHVLPSSFPAECF
jgi:carbonic anhydrase